VGRVFALRHAPIAVLLWLALMAWDAARMPDSRWRASSR